MKFFILAYKNLKRIKLRSFLTIGGVAVAVAVLVSLLGFNAGYQDALTSDVDKMGYQVVVTAKGCPYEAATMILNGEAGLKFIDEDIYKQITSDPDIDKITPLLAQLAYDPEKMEGKGGFTNYLGIEESYIPLKPNVEIVKGEWFSGNDVNEAILGYDAAESEQKSVGDKISIPGKDITFTIVGVFNRTGSQEDGTVFLPLKTTQRIFDTEGKLTGIGIKLKQIEKISEFEDRLYPIASIQVISMSQVKGTILNLVNSAKVLIMSVAFIAIFVAILGVINTILMSVSERTQEIDIEIKKSEFVAIMGPSGAGKTTFLNLVGCLDGLTSGKLNILGCDPTGLNENKLSRIRVEKIGFVFEDFFLISSLNALENVQLPLIFSRNYKNNNRPRDLLKRVGLSHRLTHFPNELSGGELQRVAVARALANNPEVLIADEPTGNLDSKNAQELFTLFRDLNREKGLTIIVATHNIRLGYSADRVIHLSDGKIEKDERLVG